jgi:hypothetical protein
MDREQIKAQITAVPTCPWCDTPTDSPDAAWICGLPCHAALAVEHDRPWPKEICRGSYSWDWVVEVAGPIWDAGSPELRRRWALVKRHAAMRIEICDRET